MSNANLVQAKSSKDDEYYTTLSMIEKELIHYKDLLKNRIIYCNCDTDDSNFVKFLNSVKDDWSIKDVWNTSIQSGVDFRSDYAIDLLNKCDIVITNPPFSLAKEYFELLFKFNKKFLIIANLNSINHDFIFDKFKSNDIHFGYTIHSGHSSFLRPDGSYKEVSVRWYTNIKDNTNSFMKLNTNCNYFDYFDDTDILCIDKSKDIPEGYTGIMAVPITFLDKYCDKQFELVSLIKRGRVNGVVKYARVCIRLKEVN